MELISELSAKNYSKQEEGDRSGGSAFMISPLKVEGVPNGFTLKVFASA